VTPVRAPDGSDLAGVTRSGEPVVDGRPDLASLDGRIAGTGVAGDQQDDALSRGDCAIQPAVDRRPCLVEVEAVEVDDSIRIDGAGAKPPVPAGI